MDENDLINWHEDPKATQWVAEMLKGLYRTGKKTTSEEETRAIKAWNIWLAAHGADYGLKKTWPINTAQELDYGKNQNALHNALGAIQQLAEQAHGLTLRLLTDLPTISLSPGAMMTTTGAYSPIMHDGPANRTGLDDTDLMAGR